MAEISIECLEEGTASIEESAAFMGMPRSWLYEQLRAGSIPSFKVGRRLAELARDGS